MGNDINVTSVTSGKSKIFTLTKKDPSGQTYTMTATIFDRNKTDNLTKNVDASPSDMIIDSKDAIQFKGDFAHFEAKDVASVQCALFEGYDGAEYESGSVNDTDVQKSWSGNKLSGITLDTGKKAIKLGQFKEALEQLSPSDCAQGNQAPAQGTQGSGGTMQMPSYTNPFQLPSMPDARGIRNFIEEGSFREVMCLPDSFDAQVCAASGAIANKALGAIFGAGFQRMAALARTDYGNGGSYGNVPSGSTSSSNSVDTAAAQKAADDAKKEADAKKAEAALRDKKLGEAKKKQEEEITPILEDLNKAIRNPGGIGTDNEKLLETVKKINKNNVSEVLDSWEKSRYANELNEKSLVKLIGDVTDGWSNIENFTHPLTPPSLKYLNPIKEALKERSNSPEAIQIANDADINYNSSLKWNDNKGIDTIHDLYKQVKKEEKEHPEKIPMVIEVDKGIKAEKDKAQAASQAEAKAKADAKKEETEAKRAEEVRLAKVVTDVKEAAAAKKHKKKPTQAEIDKAIAAEKIKIDEEKAAAKADKVQKAANEKAEKETAKKKEQEIKDSNKKAKADLGIKEQPWFGARAWNYVFGDDK